MKDWVKLNSYDRLHQAELRKEVLKDNNINAITIRKKDSAFLLGEIELYVENRNIEKARALIDEFEGWTRVNSYYYSKPVRLLEKILEQNGLETLFLDKKEVPYLLSNYELFVKNTDAPRAREIIMRLEGWKNIAVVDKINQAIHRVKLLNDNGIECIVVKQRDSSMHVETIRIYVESQNEDTATRLLSELPGWSKIDRIDKQEYAEIKESLLQQNNIELITKLLYADGNFLQTELFVKNDAEQKAKRIIAENKKWKCFRIYNNMIEAEFCNEILSNNNIDSVVMIKKDSAFLIGGIELYVEDENTEKAEKIVEECDNMPKS